MTGNTVVATISINGVFFITLTSLFEYYRNKLPDLYAPRTRGNNPKHEKPRTGYFQWLFQLYEVGDEEMFRIAGMDGYVFLRFILFCCKLCTITALCGAIILIPCYATSPMTKHMNHFEMVTMANINQGGPRLWVSFIFAYLFVLLFLYLIHKEYANFVLMRNKFFHREVEVIPLQTRYTIQVENIPEALRSSEQLFAAFDRLFPGEVMYAHIAVSTPELDILIVQRNKVRDELERAIALYEGNGRQNRPVLDLRKFNPLKYTLEKEVDSISFLTKRLYTLCSRVEQLQRAVTEYNELQPHAKSPRSPTTTSVASALSPTTAATSTGQALDMEQIDSLASAPQRVSQDSTHSSEDDIELTRASSASQLLTYNPLQGALALRRFSAILHDVRTGLSAHFLSTTGFVTFHTRKAQLTAVRTSILLERHPLMTAVQAPPPGDVIWANISASTRATEETAVFSAGMYYSFLGVWGGVMAFVAAASSLSTLEAYLPFVRNFDVYAHSIVEGILPVIVVLSFSTIVSEVIAFIARSVEKRKTNSAVEMEVFKWYFMYQIANIYLILVAGSVWQSIVRAVEHPAAIITYLSTALPTVSTFFMNYILTVALAGVPYKLIRRFRALEYLLFCYTHFDKYTTRRMIKSGPYRDTKIQYGTEMSDVLYVLCVVLLYWVIAPVVVLFAVPLFWGWFYMWKYQYVFVVTRSFESGGEMWYKLYQYAMVGLLAGTLAFIAYMGIKEGAAQGPLLVPLPVLIVVVWRHTEMQFKGQSQTMPFDLAIHDDFNTEAEIELKQRQFHADFMKHPNLVDPAQIFPYPYRVQNVPLFDSHGALNDVYVDDLSEPVDVTQQQKQLAQLTSDHPTGETTHAVAQRVEEV